MRPIDIDEAEMVRMFLAGTTQKHLADRYGCSESLIQRRVHEHRIANWPTQTRAKVEVSESVNADDDMPWQSRGLCNDYDADLFFHDLTIRNAKSICGTCLWVTECLDDALASGEKYGVRGGLSADERRRLLQDRDRKQAAA